MTVLTDAAYREHQAREKAKQDQHRRLVAKIKVNSRKK
jgi:hypothetical protein